MELLPARPVITTTLTADSVIDNLTSGIKAGKHCEAICEAVRRIGQVLQSHFPYLKDDKDELHNLIVR